MPKPKKRREASASQKALADLCREIKQYAPWQPIGDTNIREIANRALETIKHEI